MSKSGKTYMGLILDESGSMMSGKAVVLNGFNKQIDLIKAAEGVGDVFVSYLPFSYSPVSFKYKNVPPSQLGYLDEKSYLPCGGTALYDAIGRTIEFLESCDDGEATTAFLVDILTDGAENSSKFFTGAWLKEKIEKLQATGRWTFSLMGPQDSVMDLNKVLSITATNVKGYDVTSIAGTINAFDSQLSGKMAYMTARSMGATQCTDFYAQPESSAGKPNN